MLITETPSLYDPRKSYIPMMFALAAGLLNHSIFFAIFYSFSIWPLFYFHVISVILFLTLIFLLSKRLISSSAMLWASVEVISHQILSVSFLGWDYGFQYYLLVIPGFILFGEFKGKFIPILFSILSLSVLLFLFFFSD